MPENTVHVIATFLPATGKEDELERVLLEMIEPTRREAGCIRYDLVRSLQGDGSTELVFVEEWESAAALDAHGRAPHLLALRGKVKDLISAPPKVSRYRQVG